MSAAIHLSDDELQALAEADQTSVTVPEHLVACGACREGVRAYHAIGRQVAAVPRALPPVDFTSSLLARLPPSSPALSPDDLLAVAIAAAAALAATVSFVRGDAAAWLFELLSLLPGRAIGEALLATSLQGGDQIELLLFLAAAALAIGAALWRVLVRSQIAVATRLVPFERSR